ncbi:MAG TPA: hypothetical protein P5022_18045, partial [Candidatus Paceibacterota bacterium]|nr:hypothetical protein [Candidatus Paceibacterota bacterium]
MSKNHEISNIYPRHDPREEDAGAVRSTPVGPRGRATRDTDMIFDWLHSLFSADLAIDLGTATALIYEKGR